MPKDDDKIRTFIAIPISEDLKSHIGKTSSKFMPKDLKGISQVKVNSIHLTLKFLGELDSDSINKVKEVLAKTTKDLKSFKLKLSDFKYLPSKHRFRTVALGIEDNIELNSLFDIINKSLSESGLAEKSSRVYTPHLTIFRLKTKGAGKALSQSIDSFTENSKDEYSGLFDLTFKAAEVVLYKSTLTEGGAIHEPLGTFELTN